MCRPRRGGQHHPPEEGGQKLLRRLRILRRELFVMPEVILILLLAALLAAAVILTVKKLRRGGGCCGEHAPAEKRLAVRDKHRAHYPHEAVLQIGGMTCENCARRVENALNALEGTWAKVDLGAGTAHVRLKEPPDTQLLRRTVAAAGYAVTEIR